MADTNIHAPASERPWATRDEPGTWRSVLLAAGLALAVAAVVAAVYWPVLSAQAMTFDDQEYLTDNPLVRRPGLESTRHIFFEVLRPSTIWGYYHPLPLVSLMIDYALGGRPEDLYVFHRTGLILHAAGAALLVALITLLFGRPWVAAAAGLLFGLHPVHVEALAWLGQRKAILAGFFAMACLLLYAVYVRRASRTGYWAAWAACALALLAKPTGTPLPVLLLILDYWPLQRLNRRAVLEKIPFFILAGVSTVITIASHIANGRLSSPGRASAWQTPLLLGYKVFLHLEHLFWPSRLTSYYVPPQTPSPISALVLGPLIGLVLLLAGVAVSMRWTRAVAAGTAFFLLALLPTLGLVGYSWVFTFDNYLYIPSVGLVLILAWMLAKAVQAPPRRAVAAVCALAVLAAAAGLAAGTRRYLDRWKDTETLYAYMLELTPGEARLHNNLGVARHQKGDTLEALLHFQQAVELDPSDSDSHYNLARLLAEFKRTDEAIHHYQEVIRIVPDYAHAHNNLGALLSAQGHLEEAIRQFASALRIKPDFPEAHANLGVALERAGRFDEAARHFTTALQRRPDDALLHYHVGLCLLRQDRPDEAVPPLQEALRLRPDLQAARDLLLEALRPRSPGMPAPRP